MSMGLLAIANIVVVAERARRMCAQRARPAGEIRAALVAAGAGDHIHPGVALPRPAVQSFSGHARAVLAHAR